MQSTWKYEGRQRVDPTLRDDSIEMDVFRWTATSDAGKLSIPFGCVLDEKPRRYFCLPAWSAWQRGVPPERFLQQVCRVGGRCLSQFEAALQANHRAPEEAGDSAWAGKVMTADEYEFARAIFRNRRLGYTLPTRSFRHPLDFYLQRKHRGECVIPGIEGLTQVSRTERAASELLTQLQKLFLGGEVAVAPATDDPIPAHCLPGRTPLDQFLLDGVCCPASAWDVYSTYASVSKVLIHGFDQEQQSGLIQENPEEWNHFYGRLLSAFVKRKRGEKSFDRWLRTVHEEGLWRLLPGGSRLPLGKRDAARCRANAYYRHLLWAAYQATSRSYGFAMLNLWLSFGLSEVLSPTDVEKQLFRQLHCPQLYLAGLPLVYFAPAQLRWIIRPLLENWNRECFHPQVYAKLPSILGLYAAASDALRAHDRDKKRRQRAVAAKGRPSQRGGRKASPRCPEDGEAVFGAGGAGDVACTDREPVLDDPLRFPACEDGRCSVCRTKTILLGNSSQLAGWIVVDVYCPQCESESTVRVRAR
jgi:hypothetical protein